MSDCRGPCDPVGDLRQMPCFLTSSECLAEVESCDEPCIHQRTHSSQKKPGKAKISATNIRLCHIDSALQHRHYVEHADQILLLRPCFGHFSQEG